MSTLKKIGIGNSASGDLQAVAVQDIPLDTGINFKTITEKITNSYINLDLNTRILNPVNPFCSKRNSPHPKSHVICYKKLEITFSEAGKGKY